MSEANNPPNPTPGGARPPSTDDAKRKEGGQKQMGEDDIVDPGPTNTTEPRTIPRDKPGGMEGEG